MKSVLRMPYYTAELCQCPAIQKKRQMLRSMMQAKTQTMTLIYLMMQMMK